MPSLSKRIKARTTGKLKRYAKKTVNPMYGKKGMGYITNPKKAVYNKVYNKTSISVDNLFKLTGNWLIDILLLPLMLIYYAYKYLFLAIIWIVKKIFYKNQKDEKTP